MGEKKAVEKAATASSQNQNTFFPQAEGALSYLSEIGSFEAVAGTFGYGGRAGYRWGDWGAFLQWEHNIWLLTDIGEQPVDSVFNVGIGGDVLYFKDRVRTSFALGTSTTLFDTILDEFGTTGFFFDIRPTGFRLPLDDEITVEIIPLSLIIMVPIIEGIPLVQLAHRSVFSIEVAF